MRTKSIWLTLILLCCVSPVCHSLIDMALLVLTFRKTNRNLFLFCSLLPLHNGLKYFWWLNQNCGSNWDWGLFKSGVQYSVYLSWHHTNHIVWMAGPMKVAQIKLLSFLYLLSENTEMLIWIPINMKSFWFQCVPLILKKLFDTSSAAIEKSWTIIIGDEDDKSETIANYGIALDVLCKLVNPV